VTKKITGVYQSIFRPVTDLELPLRRAMANLYLSHFDGTFQKQFFRDLFSKTEALLLYYSGNLVGFSTIEYYPIIWGQTLIRVVYSGDTIVHPNHWGQQVMAFRWIERMGQVKRQQPEVPLYWFLIVKGHRTYRFLPAFAREFHPGENMARPDLKDLSDFLATEKFGKDYNSTTGVVEFIKSRGHLAKAIAQPTPRETAKAEVQFFLKRNPGYQRGHELVCLCELKPDNLKPLARRLFQKDRP
jgi:hypothetical protein